MPSPHPKLKEGVVCPRCAGGLVALCPRGGAVLLGLFLLGVPFASPSRAGPPLVVEQDLPQPRESGKRVQLLYSSDLYGRFAWPGCQGRAHKHAELSHLVAAVSHLRKRAQLAGHPRPLLLLGGSTIRPDILGNFIFSESPQLASRFRKVFARLAPDGVGVGLYDFGAAPETLTAYLHMLSTERIPALAGNVSCLSKSDTRCRSLGFAGAASAGVNPRFRVVERGGIKVGIFGVIREDLPRRVLGRSGGIRAADPVKWSRALIRRLREEKRVDVVVAIANLNLENDVPGPVLDYLRALGKEVPDVVIANGMFERASRSGYLRQIRRGKTLIVGTDRFGQTLGEVTLRFARDGGGYRIAGAAVRQLRSVDYAPDVAASIVVRGAMKALCKEVDRAIGRGYFKESLSYADFLEYMMQVMRTRTGAEIALLNDSGIADTSFPMSGRLTWEKLLRAIRTETHVGHVRLTGSRLKSLLTPYVKGGRAGLRVLGLSKKLKVNGRSLIEGHEYRVALTRFVHSGGDGLVKLSSRERFSDLGVELRDLATDFFGGDGQSHHDKKLDVAPARDFPDLARRWLLHGGIDADFSLSNVAVENGASGDVYSLPPLRRDNITTLEAKLAFNLGAITKHHALELDGELAYGRSYTKVQGQDETTEGESVDRITASFLYKLRALKHTRGDQWYVPEPYAEARLVSEFTASGVCEARVCVDAGDQSYHYMDVGGTAGLGLLLHPLLFVKLGAVLRGEVLTPDAKNPDITARPGIYVGYLLRKWKLLPSVAFPIQLESRLDFYFTDFAAELRRELTLASRLYLGLTRRLALTVGHQLYVFAKRSQPAAWGNAISVGLALSMDFRRQTF